MENNKRIFNGVPRPIEAASSSTRLRGWERIWGGGRGRGRGRNKGETVRGGASSFYHAWMRLPPAGSGGESVSPLMPEFVATQGSCDRASERAS